MDTKQLAKLSKLYQKKFQEVADLRQQLIDHMLPNVEVVGLVKQVSKRIYFSAKDTAWLGMGYKPKQWSKNMPDQKRIKKLIETDKKAGEYFSDGHHEKEGVSLKVLKEGG